MLDITEPISQNTFKFDHYLSGRGEGTASMRRYFALCTSLIFSLVILSHNPVASGGIITNVDVIPPAIFPGTPIPGDFSGTSPNFALWGPEFGVDVDDFSPVDIEVTVENNGVLTEYLAVNPLRRSKPTQELPSLPLMFTGFELEIIADAANSELDFDWPAPDSPVGFDGFEPDSHEPHRLRWTDLQAIDDQSNLQFHIDIPDFGSIDDTYSFTLRYTPIPEPASLCGMVFFGVAVLRRRNHRR